MVGGLSNNMTLLLNKIETRLGVDILNLPEHLAKNKWADKVIIPDTLVTFSRYFPHQFKYRINNQTAKKKDGYYYLDEDLICGVKILGVKDISWDDFGNDSIGIQQSSGFGIYDFLGQNYGIDDVGLLQMRADHMSLFNNGIYVDFEPPNKVKLSTATNNDVTNGLSDFHIMILVEHNKSLTTISPTQMEIFESLAQADIAKFLYNRLKYFEGLQTVHATIDLKLSELQDEASKRDDVISKLEDNYVSASNKNQPYILTV